MEGQGTETPVDLNGRGTESPEELNAQGIENSAELSAQGMKVVDGIKTLDDKKSLSAETLSDIIMQTFDDLDLDEDGTCFESVIEKTFIAEDLSTAPSTLYLNSRIVDLE